MTEALARAVANLWRDYASVICPLGIFADTGYITPNTLMAAANVRDLLDIGYGSDDDIEDVTALHYYLETRLGT